MRDALADITASSVSTSTQTAETAVMHAARKTIPGIGRTTTIAPALSTNNLSCTF